MAKESAKDRVRKFLLANVGRIVTGEEISAAAGIIEWARRLRELRDEEGWPIHSHNDDASLKPGEYRLVTPPSMRKDVAFERAISRTLRSQVLDRNGFTCQMCGLTPGEVDPGTGRKVHMHIGHIVDKSLGGKDELSNLRALCSSCNEGAKNVTQQKPSTIWLLSQVRRAGIDEQRAVYGWLATKFGDG
ncbi:MAG TPA: HNH endonuclease [Sphingomonas sp.]|uniref:HNH endonuclease n=1 Tax=Sphingomonas sp. TaxID=28214 RepID=UPI002ED9C745